MREYVYRKHLRHPFKLMLGILAVIVSISIYVEIIMSIGSSELEIVELLISELSLIPIIGGVQLLIFYPIISRKFKYTSVSIGGEGIIYNNRKGEKIIKYEEIEKIKFSSVKYSGGWVKIKYKGGNIKLTVVLEGIGEFLKELKLSLDENDMSHTYKEKKFYSFYKTATYSDQSWDRMYSKFNKILVMEGICAVIGIILSSLINEMQIKVSLSIMILIYPLIAFIIAEAILGFKLSKSTSVDGYEIRDRDIASEDKLYKNIYIIVAVVITICVLTIIFIK